MYMMFLTLAGTPEIDTPEKPENKDKFSVLYENKSQGYAEFGKGRCGCALYVCTWFSVCNQPGI